MFSNYTSKENCARKDVSNKVNVKCHWKPSSPLVDGSWKTGQKVGQVGQVGPGEVGQKSVILQGEVTHGGLLWPTSRSEISPSGNQITCCWPFINLVEKCNIFQPCYVPIINLIQRAREHCNLLYLCSALLCSQNFSLATITLLLKMSVTVSHKFVWFLSSLDIIFLLFSTRWS